MKRFRSATRGLTGKVDMPNDFQGPLEEWRRMETPYIRIDPILMRALVAAACLLSVHIAPTIAQDLHGRVVASDTREPIVGAFVVLRDSSGTRWGAALTNSAGVYHVRAYKPGRFTIVAERIGYESASTAFIDLPPGAVVTQDFVLDIRPIVLPPVAARPGERCEQAPENARRTAQVWDEARKALTVASWAAQEKLIKYEIVRYSRALDRNGERILREYVEHSTELKTGTPWLVPDPEDLIRNGFAQPRGPDITYYDVPGAEVLLSAAFLRSHCFGLRDEPSRPNQIGLTFRPIRSNPNTDVRGTLWLDRRTIALQQIEYEYVLGAAERSSLGGGGAMDYVQLPSGFWLATGWRLHLRLRAITGRRADLFLLQEGSEVVHGLTHDSITIWKPVTQKVGTQFAINADSAMAAPAGAPHLPHLSPAALVIKACGYRVSDRNKVEVIVFVGDTQGTPRADVPVQIVWYKSRDPASLRDGKGEGKTDGNGLYVLCSVPAGRRLTISVGTSEENWTVVPLTTQRGVILTRSFLFN